MVYQRGHARRAANIEAAGDTARIRLPGGGDSKDVDASRKAATPAGSAHIGT
jgi:hypothetical protein